jgi:tRNA(Ile)-lysidine synthase
LDVRKSCDVSRCDEAIAAGEADRALATLSRFGHVVLAVSGGPDSLALLYMVSEWKKRRGSTAPSVSIVTVDHGLRPESGYEAEVVARHAAALGLTHTALRWEGVKPTQGIPNAARNARYKLLHAYALTLCVGSSVAVVTAHHQDDQAETVFMRLARGGGVDALAGMPSERALQEGSPVRLVRPLLAFSKSQLIATLAARGVGWIDDPTNSNMNFERARVRQTLEASGLDRATLATTARRMQEAREGLAYAKGLFKETLSLALNDGVYARLERKAFAAGPAILRQAVLADLIGTFGGATPQPEASEIEALARRLASADAPSSTLGGAQISAGERYIRVWREAGRLSLPEVFLTVGERQLWDDRFWVSFTGEPGTPISVRPLGRDGYAAIADRIPERLSPPVAAACALPAFWADATLLAVPQLAVNTGAGQYPSGLVLLSEPIFRD